MTQSCGLRVLWRAPSGAKLRTVGGDQHHDGLGLFWEGKQVVLPPSSGPKGQYRWLPGHSPWQVGFSAAPATVLVAMGARAAGMRRTIKVTVLPVHAYRAATGNLGPDRDGRLVDASLLPYDLGLLRDGVAAGERREAVRQLELQMLAARWTGGQVVAATGVAPNVRVAAVPGGDGIRITVRDNGPGLRPEVLARILDFSTITSDKAAYRSPTRGAQDNALKTVLSIPYALAGESAAPIIVEACGVRHTIRPWVTPAGEVRIPDRQEAGTLRSGTRITVSLQAAGQKDRTARLLLGYRLFNPHAGSVPFVVEVAVAEVADGHGLGTGLNCAPSYSDPFAATLFRWEHRDTAHVATGLHGLLHELRSAPGAEHGGQAVVVHLASPALSFTDKGKTHLALPPELAGAIRKAVCGACREHERLVRQEEGDAERAARERVRLGRGVTRDPDMRQAVFAVLPEAVRRASAGGTYPFSARSLYYQVRPLLQAQTSKDLDYGYFTPPLLTEYQQRHGPVGGLYYDPRGYLLEPHSGKTVPLGTRDVEAYRLPDWRFNKVLYVEKKGLLPVLQAARLAERYDMAIIGAEGYASRAAKALLAAAEGTGSVTVLVLQDADVDGYNIARTLREATRTSPHAVQVAEVARLLNLDALAARLSDRAVAIMDMAAILASVRDGLQDNPPEPWGHLTAQAAVATADLSAVRAAAADALRSASLA